MKRRLSRNTSDMPDWDDDDDNEDLMSGLYWWCRLNEMRKSGRRFNGY